MNSEENKEIMPSYVKADQENQTWEYPYQRGPVISNREHSQRGKIAVFQELLHPEIHHDKLWKGITDSTSQGKFFPLGLPVD